MNSAPGSRNDPWSACEAMLTQFHASAPWYEPTEFEYNGFFQAAVEASELEGGETLLSGQQPLAFDASLTVQYIGEGTSEDGSIFYAFLFQGSAFDAFIWIEDNLRRARLVWRGDEDACVNAELMLRIFEGETLAHLR